MVELYLPKTDASQFRSWLQTYCLQENKNDRAYEFSKGWNYKLYYPVLDPIFEDENSIRFTARIYRAYYRPGGTETTETMANNLGAIKVEWQEAEDGLKVTISHHEGLWVMPPLNDLLTKIRTDWPAALSDNWTPAES